MPTVKKAAFTAEKSKELCAELKRFVPRSAYLYNEIFLKSARGAALLDVDGNSYVDFSGGIGVLNVGHGHPRVLKAVHEQLDKFQHISFHVMPYELYVRVAQKLCALAPGSFPKKALLFNSGAEAVENAVKTARAFTGRPGIICFDHAFHGRTSLALALCGKEKPLRSGFGPFPGEIYRAPFPYPYRPPTGVSEEDLSAHCLNALETLLACQTSPEKVAAVIVEPVLGEGGFVAPPAEFLRGIKKLCERHGILFIADEIQTGFGRTGKMFAIEHSGVAPDLMTVAKSMAGGLPLSALVGRADVMDAPPPASQGGTYGGNPLACAAALAVFEAFEKEKLLDRAVAVGNIVQKRFDGFKESFEFVGDSRGLGPMRAIELVRSRQTKEPMSETDMKWILAECARRGLIALKAGLYGNVLRCLVPLVVSDEELERGLGILEEVLKEYSSR